MEGEREETGPERKEGEFVRERAEKKMSVMLPAWKWITHS